MKARLQRWAGVVKGWLPVRVVMAFGGLLCILAILVAVPVALVLLIGFGWIAAAVWAAVYLLIGIGLVLVGKARLRIGLPSRTITSLKETKAWALHRLRSTTK